MAVFFLVNTQLFGISSIMNLEQKGFIMIAAIIILACLVLFFIVTYNSLVAGRQNVKEAWATVNTQLKRRYDLIPNLVEVVKGYAKHERETLAAVIEARSAAMSAKGVAGKNAEEGALSGALKSLFALSESYPDLKANTNFLELQQELSDTETKIQAARQFYNTVVQSMNIKVKSFPSNIVAAMFHFSEEKYFELDEAEREAVKHAPSVKF